MPETPPRVVITGLGAVTAIGLDVPTMWANMLEGRTGIGEITRFDHSRYEHKAAAEVSGFLADQWLSPRIAKRCDRVVHWAVSTAKQALADSGLEITEENCEDVGVVYGSAGGSHETADQSNEVFRTKGVRAINPYTVAYSISDASSGCIAIETGAKGHNICVTTACSTGTSCIGEALEVIRRGDCVAVIAGASENPIMEKVHAAYINMRGLGLPLPGEPISTVCRPFDRTRNGFVLGEGAGALILEELSHARARGARIYAEVVGYGATADAYDMVVPAAEGEGSARAMTRALRRGRVPLDEVDMINPHGTSTPIGDKRESEAIRAVFGQCAESILVSATKTMTGHMMGASGAIEGIACALSLHHGVVPGTLNYREPDPDCAVTVCAETMERPLRYAVSNSLGLGGHNAAVIFKRYAGD